MPSTVIRDFSYNVASRRLVVTFVTGSIYAYAEVPPDVVNAFRNSGSRGRFFNQEIRDSYACREITSKDPKDSKESAPLRMAPDHKTVSRR